MNLKMFAAIFTSVLLGSFGQIFLKLGVNNFVFLLIGIGLYGTSTIIYFYVLSKKDLSWSYSFIGLSYVIVNLLSLLLRESFSIFKFAGSIAIAIGVTFVALS